MSAQSPGWKAWPRSRNQALASGRPAWGSVTVSVVPQSVAMVMRVRALVRW